ncbi:MAG: hypothetical protein LBH51_07670 [Treponema sp.]|jgi:hypothetical protein|nr:hypothetical protein [Treponema sp.]
MGCRSFSRGFSLLAPFQDPIFWRRGLSGRGNGGLWTGIFKAGFKVKRIFITALFLAFFVLSRPPSAPAQEEALDWDFDTLFDDPDSPDPADEDGQGGDIPGGHTPDGDNAPPAAAGDSVLAGLLRRSGFSLDLSYSANGGFSPGWSESPWFSGSRPAEYSHILGVNLYSYLGMDVRISESFRAHSSLAFMIPEISGLSLKEFYIDYNMFNRLFFRVGKFAHNWGISPNFPAANLLSRVPEGNSGGDSYIIKADIPVGIGGLQILSLTRPGFMRGSTPEFKELGYGGKYNLAFDRADIDAGLFYHQEMPLRGFLSIKTTVKNTEVYAETMGAIQHTDWDRLSFSANLGLVQSFFNEVVTLNGEIFWNGEDNAFFFNPQTELEDAFSSPFLPGLNAALNLAFKPNWIWNLRFALASRWVLDTNSAYLLPALSFTPLSYIDVSLGFPIALGSRDGRYYRNNQDKNNRPFGIALLINLSGSYNRSFF